MIYTNNIEEFAKELEHKLNQNLGSQHHKIFTIEVAEEILYVNIYWCLNMKELEEIKKYLGDFFITKGNRDNTLLIWNTYEERDE